MAYFGNTNMKKFLCAITMALMLTVFLHPAFAEDPAETAPLPQTTGVDPLKWAWRKVFEDAELSNLDMTWNGTTLLFTATIAPIDPKTPDAKVKAKRLPKGDLIFIMSGNSKAVNDWDTKDKIKNLYIAGSGESAMAETADGKFNAYQSLEKNVKVVPLKYAVKGAVPSQTLGNIATFGEEEAALYDSDGKKLWTYPQDDVKAGTAMFFPFYKDPHDVLFISPKGGVSLFHGEKPAWSVQLGAPVTAYGSAYIDGGILAFGVGNDLVMLDEDGKIKGKGAFNMRIGAIACSQTGNICAAYGAGKREQKLSVFSTDGKEQWSYTAEGQAQNRPRVYLTLTGETIVAGFDEKSGSAVRAFGPAGQKLWHADFEGGLKDFKLSWNGDKIAAITRDGAVTYYDLDNRN
jgi:outer membrane protein assembly factor BamB